MLRLALEIISLECSKHHTCGKCPLRDPNNEEGKCMFQNDDIIPEDWQFSHREEQIEECLFR